MCRGLEQARRRTLGKAWKTETSKHSLWHEQARRRRPTRGAPGRAARSPGTPGSQPAQQARPRSSTPAATPGDDHAQVCLNTYVCCSCADYMCRSSLRPVSAAAGPAAAPRTTAMLWSAGTLCSLRTM